MLVENNRILCLNFVLDSQSEPQRRDDHVPHQSVSPVRVSSRRKRPVRRTRKEAPQFQQNRDEEDNSVHIEVGGTKLKVRSCKHVPTEAPTITIQDFDSEDITHPASVPELSSCCFLVELLKPLKVISSPKKKKIILKNVGWSRSSPRQQIHQIPNTVKEPLFCCCLLMVVRKLCLNYFCVNEW